MKIFKDESFTRTSHQSQH